MPRNLGTSRKGKPGKFERAAGMGKALQKATRPPARQKMGGMTRQVGVETIGATGIVEEDAKTTNTKSILERNDLEDFLHQADMANREFASEKESHVVIETTASYVNHKKQQPYSNATNAAVTTFASGGGATTTTTDFVFKELSVPRRPAWDETTTKHELDARERHVFLEWRRAIASREEQLVDSHAVATPFEKNIEVWRQLWRVLERSACLLQILDARNPLFYLSEDLKDYATNELGKPMMVLINKADYLTATQRREWSDYLMSIGWERPVFFSAVMEQQKIDDAARRERRRHEGRIGSGNSGELEENNNNDKLEGEEEEEEDPADEKSAESEGANVTSGGGPDDGGIARPLTRQELIDTLRRYAHDHNCQPDPRFDDRIQFGMLGFPNVGKSSVINVLLGASKMAHGQARVAVASQPGKTKHFQTLLLSDTDIMLCDCPGLVFPSFVSNTADLIAAGVYPIAQMRHFWPVMKLICERIPREILQAQYGIKLQPGPCTPEHFLDTYCIARSLLAAASGVPDHQPASRTIIKDYADGKLLYCHPPPHSDKDQFYLETFKTALQNTERLRRKLGNAEALLLEKGGDDDDVAESDAATLMMTSPVDGFLADILSDPMDDDNDDAAAGQRKHGKVGNRGRTPKQKWGKKDRKNRDKDPYGCHSASASGVGVVLNSGKYSAVGYTRPVSYPTVTSTR